MLFLGLSFGQSFLQKQSTIRTETPLTLVRQSSLMAGLNNDTKATMADATLSLVQPSRATISTPKQAVQPPYRCGFDQADVLEREWIVADADGDKKTWYWRDHKNWPTYNGDTTSGFVLSLFRTLAGNQADFLITRNPVAMPAGGAYVAFHYGSKLDGYRDSLCVYWSKSSDPNFANLHYIGSVLNNVSGWHHEVLTFNLPEAGDVYFHFVNQSRSDQFGIWLDNIDIGTGEFRGSSPDIQADRLVLPLSQCGLGSSEKISVQVSNVGLTPITKLKLTYTIEGGNPVSEEFERTIGISRTAYLTFTQKADFSSTDKKYKATVKAEVLACASEETEAENRTRNNYDTAYVTNFSPASMPFSVDLRTPAGRDQMGYGATYWVENESGLQGLMIDAPLSTRCMPLSAAAEYRFKLQYKAGISLNSAIMNTDFEIRYGRPGTAVSEWTLLKSYTKETGYTQGEIKEDEFTFTNRSEGNYSFAIVPKPDMMGKFNQELYIAGIRVESLREHDVKLAAVRSSMGRYTPAQHMLSPQFDAMVINRGLTSERAKVEAYVGESRIGSSKTTAVAPGDTGVYAFGAVMTRPAVGSETTLKFNAVLADNTDEYLDDNSIEWKVSATDSLYAFDDITITQYKDGVGLQNIPLGLIFTLAEKDTLTAVQIGKANLSASYPAAFKAMLEVYAVNDENKVGACLLAQPFVRTLDGELQTIKFPARVLASGRYYIAVRQLSGMNVALGIDENPSGYIMAMIEDRVYALSDYGYVALRAVFGHEAKAPAKDVAVELLRPRARGIFSANEPIEVAYNSKGHQAVDVNFTCEVDGQVIKTEKVTVSAYAKGTLLFSADLSKVGRHDIKVTASSSGDEDLTDNVAQKTVESAAFDPYVMDFELCEDFAIEDLQPWHTIDYDGKNTSTITGFTWPNARAPQAFMAFNPSQVPISMIEPHEGDKLGAVFALVSGAGANNDWLISPKLKLPSANAYLSFYTKAFRPQVYTEKYKVYISTTTDDSASFMPVGETVYTAPEEWDETVVDLSTFNGKEVYLAIQCVSNQAYIFFIDDIQVSRPSSATEQIDDLSRYVRSYPNPASETWTVTAYGTEINRVEICNMQGGVVFRSASGLNTESYRVSMSGFTPGLYMARIYTPAGVQTLKVMVQ